MSFRLSPTTTAKIQNGDSGFSKGVSIFGYRLLQKTEVMWFLCGSPTKPHFPQMFFNYNYLRPLALAVLARTSGICSPRTAGTSQHSR